MPVRTLALSVITGEMMCRRKEKDFCKKHHSGRMYYSSSNSSIRRDATGSFIQTEKSFGVRFESWKNEVLVQRLPFFGSGFQ